MNTVQPERIWITAASEGLGHALAVDLLERGCHVAVSGTLSAAQREAFVPYGNRLHILQGNLLDDAQAALSRDTLEQLWGGLDGLVINAGGCDYLAPGQVGSAIFEAMVASQLTASAIILKAAAPLLAQGHKPWVMALVSTFTALQRYEPSQPATPANSLLQLFEEARAGLKALTADLLLVAPQTVKKPLTLELVAPAVWGPEDVSHALIERLSERPGNLLLDAQTPHLLWPLPR